MIVALKTHQTPRVNPSESRVSYLQLNDFRWLECLVSYCLVMKLCDSDKRIERVRELLRHRVTALQV